MNLGGLAVLIAAVIFGAGGGWFVKTLALPASVIVAFRLVVPAVALLLTSSDRRRRLLTGLNKTLTLASTLTALRVLCWVLALRYSSISKVIFIQYAWPIIFVGLNSYLSKERVTAFNKALLAIGFIGALIIFSGERLDLQNPDLLGMGLMLVVALLNATVMTVFKRELARRSPEDVVIYDCVVGGVLSLPFLIYYSGALSLESASLGIIYGLTIGLLGYWLLYFGLARLPAEVASVLCYMEVVSATALGVLVFGETLTWKIMIGGVFVIIAALGSQLKSKK